MITGITLLQSRPALRFAVILGVTLLALALVNAESVIAILFPAGAIFAVALTRGLFNRDVREARWPLLFQLPVHPVAFYARAFAVTLALGLMPLITVSVTAIALSDEPQRRLIAGIGAGALVFFVLVSAVVLAISTLVRQAETELTLLYLGVTLGQDVFFNALRLPEGLRSVFSALLFPYNAVVTHSREWAGFPVEIPGHYLPQLILFTLACLAIAAYRLDRLNHGA